MALRRTLGSVLVALVAAVAWYVPLTPAAANAGADEAAFVAKINALRASHGLSPLVVDANLTTVARNWSAQMASKGTISHNPGFASQVTSNWSLLGENVGMGGSVDSVFNAFVNSPAHYRNLINSSFTYVGVGVVWNGATLFTAHQFMQTAAAPAASAPVRTRVRPTRHRSVPQAPPTTVAPTPPPPAPEPEPMLKPERTESSLALLSALGA